MNVRPEREEDEDLVDSDDLRLARWPGRMPDGHVAPAALDRTPSQLQRKLYRPSRVSRNTPYVLSLSYRDPIT